MKSFMQSAVAEAKKGLAYGDGGPFGAVIVKDGSIIAKAHNMVIHKCDPTAHAEIVAIQKAAKKLKSFDLSGCEIYATCMPCPMCMGAIMWANNAHIYYASSSQDAEDAGFRDKLFYENPSVPLTHYKEQSAQELFGMWQDSTLKVLY